MNPLIDDSPERAQYEAATQRLGFAKDFYSALEALMMDPSATYGQRFLAWLKRRSWGEFRLYAINNEGKPAIQADCSTELGIDKRKVSEVVNFYEKRGYLYREGKMLYPSISPKVASLPEKVPDSQDFSDFQESWKVTHSSDFLAWETARAEKQVLDSTVKRLEKVRLSAYKEWLTSRTNGGASLLERRESIEREEVASAASSSTTQETPPPPFPECPEEHKNGTTLAARRELDPKPARKPEPKPKPKPATKAEPEPEPEPAPEPARGPVKVEPFVEAVQAKFPQNPPTVSQCGRALATLCHLKLPLDGFIEHLTPERMSKIAHGGALDELVKGYEAAMTVKSKAPPPGCPYCGCERVSKLNGNCAGCGRSREVAVLAAERRRGG